MPNLNFLQEHLGPIVSNLIDLGSSLLRWRSIWTKDLDISGTGTASRTPTATTDIVNKAYVDAFVGAGPTVEEVDGVPSYASSATIRFDQTDGFVVTQPGTGIARVDLASIPDAAIAALAASKLTGTVSAVQGGTAIDTSASTGVATVAIGTWAILAKLTAALGGTNIDTSAATGVAIVTGGTWTTPTSLTVPFGGTGVATLTDNGILIGGGASVITATAALTDGQLVIGSTGADPVAASLTAGAGIAITPGAGSISIATSSTGLQPAFLLSPTNAVFPTTDFPQLKKGAGTNHLQYTLGFDTTTGESAYWTFMIPSTAVFTAATIKVASRQLAATSGNVGWLCVTLTRATGEAYDTAGASDTVAVTTVGGTAGFLTIQSKALTVTGWTAGEVLQVKLTRDVATDTVAEDAEFVYAVIELS